MSMAGVDLVSLALRRPHEVPHWTLAQWELLVRQARSANLLARLAALLEDLGSLEQVPHAARAHLEAALVVSRAQEEAVRREVAYVLKALARTGIDIVLLKGAAYLLAGLPAARGRLFSDIDILVPHSSLAEVEAALMLHGWATTHHDPYDQRYYRDWMHELPPMLHVARETVLDVHHAIVPITARLKPDSGKLLAASRRLAEDSRLRVLAPVDMILNSAAHLFLNEELSSGLRDLADLDSLLRQYGARTAFWLELVERARELDLSRLLYYGLRYARLILDTPVPDHARQATDANRPPIWLRSAMDALFMRALRPYHFSAADRFSSFARLALYIRAHWLRMPPALLARHLTVKAFRGREATTAAG